MLTKTSATQHAVECVPRRRTARLRARKLAHSNVQKVTCATASAHRADGNLDSNIQSRVDLQAFITRCARVWHLWRRLLTSGVVPTRRWLLSPAGAKRPVEQSKCLPSGRPKYPTSYDESSLLAGFACLSFFIKLDGYYMSYNTSVRFDK